MFLLSISLVICAASVSMETPIRGMRMIMWNHVEIKHDNQQKAFQTIAHLMRFVSMIWGTYEVWVCHTKPLTCPGQRYGVWKGPATQGAQKLRKAEFTVWKWYKNSNKIEWVWGKKLEDNLEFEFK